MSKSEIHIRDANFFSEKYPDRPNPYFKWIWDRKPLSSDICVFTDNYINEAEKNGSRIKIAWLIEPPIINSYIYNYVRNNFKVFDFILTYSEGLLSIDKSFVFYDHGTTWIHPPDRKVYSKTKMTSAIFSEKKITPGHKIRHQIASKHESRIDLFGRAYKPLKNKIEGLRDYRYQVTVENSRLNMYYTEKVMDCFMTGTVPIYWGCPKIGSIFDPNGIITFSDVADIKHILDSISEHDYLSRMDAVRINFAEAAEHVSLEKELWKNLFSKL